MSSAIGTRALRIAAALFMSGCLGSYTRAVEDTRSGLLGLSARALRGCLGVPSDFWIDGDHEQQTYRFERDDHHGDDLATGDIGGVVIGGRSADDPSRDRYGFPRDENDASYCQLDFELTGGRVTGVIAQGRTREGMNADSGCMLRAQHCVPYSDE